MQLFEYMDILNNPYDIHIEKIDHLPFSIASHWHYYGEMLYVLLGEIEVRCAEESFSVKEGQLILIAPQGLHSVLMASEAPIRYLVVRFDPYALQIPHIYISKIHLIFQALSEVKAFVFHEPRLAGTPVKELLMNCMKELEQFEFAREYNILSSLAMIMIYLFRILQNEIDCSEQTLPNKTKYFFYDTLEYIDSHSSQNIRAEELARRSGMSYSNFARQFKKQFGRTCKEYIEYVRVSKAEEMVLYSDYDLSCIAQETGFADCSHFIRVYKKFKGQTPKQVRMQMERKR